MEDPNKINNSAGPPPSAPVQEEQAVPSKKALIPQIKERLQKYVQLALRFQTTIIALVVVGLLAATALRMFHYLDPPVDDSQVQADLSKSKQIRIDSKVVQKIKQLQDSGTSTRPDLENGRTNPFSE